MVWEKYYYCIQLPFSQVFHQMKDKCLLSWLPGNLLLMTVRHQNHWDPGYHEFSGSYSLSSFHLIL